MAFPVFFDTCALYGGALNDHLLRLAERGAFRPLWSQNVLNELERNLSLRVGSGSAGRRVAAMREAFPDAEVTGYERLIDTMTCHPNDRHVLAAAVRANAEAIVTFNVRDFPSDSTDPFDLQVIHPDAFLLDQLDLYPELVIGALKGQARSYESPPMTVRELLSKLEMVVPEFAAQVLLEL